MFWLDKHFPTFKRWHRAFLMWWHERDRFEHWLTYGVTALIVIGGLYWIYIAPPSAFPSGAYIDIPPGASLSDIAALLDQRGVISYGLILKMAARVVGSDRHIPAGEYYFPSPENVITVALHLDEGDFQTTPVKITIPEGATVLDISNILVKKLPGFDKASFLNATQGQEGYLFPDTYFFLPGDSTEAILSVFNNDFHVQMLKVQSQVTASGKPIPEILTMASILEKEASDTHNRQIISGILWHRIQVGMPLQVDAPFAYILDKSANDLTTADLATPSPYNTFLNKGLPPGPIDNPSLSSITAAVTPIKTNYVYYLSDSKGVFHYATTYSQFLAYKREYIDP